MFTELYTLGGNGLGRPCNFPFLYKNEWYADCTRDDSSVKRLWCAIESTYDDNQLWGYCPTNEIGTVISCYMERNYTHIVA